MSSTNGRPVRARSLTEKGRLYELELQKSARTQFERKIRLQISKIEICLEYGQQEELKHEFAVMDTLFQKYLQAHAKCQMLLQFCEESQIDNYSTDSIDRKVLALKKGLYEKMNQSEKNSTRDVKPKGVHGSKHSSKLSSKSSKSSEKTSKSSVKSKGVQSQMAMEKARLAELEVEAQYLTKKNILEQESKELELHVEMSKAQAKIKAYEGSLVDKNELLSEHFNEKIDKEQYVGEYIRRHQVHVDSHRTDIEPFLVRNDKLYDADFYSSLSVNKDNVSLKETNQSGDINRLLRYLQAPEVEIEIFSGKPIDYQFFISTFIEVVEEKIDDPKGRLTRLLKYLEGEAKDLVKGCIYLPAKECYKEARKLLDKHYGDPYRIISEYRKELKSWPKIKPHDATAFRKFYTFLMKFKTTMKSTKCSQTYDNPELLQILQLKLPPYLQERWNRLSHKIRKKGIHEAGLDDFIQYVEEETSIVNDPNYSKAALGDTKLEDTSVSPSRRRRFKSMMTGTKVSKCPCCGKFHDLDKCDEYLKLHVNERRKFLFAKRLCFCCYEVTSKTHSAKNCKKRRKCGICQKEHPTGLHGYQRQQRENEKDNDQQKEQLDDSRKDGTDPPPKQNFVSTCTKFTTEVISLSIVPVKITHPASTVEVITNALLDNGSQGTFIHNDLLHKLQPPCVSASVSIKTMTGEETDNCQAVDNLVVSAAVGPSVKIKLPKTYSRVELPVDKDEIPTPSRVKGWKYLNEIHRFLPRDDDNIEIGILIGGNCPRALEPLEIIPSQSGGPYAYRSLLGWCVTGPISSNSSLVHRQRCNFIAVGRNGNKPVHFGIQSQLKDNTTKEMMLAMFNQDFSENQPTSFQDAEKMSQEDKRFMELMEREVRFIDGHYQLPLPLRDPEILFPNNRKQAVQRALCLKRKLEKNPKMYEDYKDFMSSIISKGYARKTTDSVLNEGKVWYIPHHGVYHPKKPDKIRVVFDCSATYQGISMNSQLLQGPDLTNQIVGVLTRFREEYIPIVGDIESMFYQVRVPQEQRDLLRFVWWDDGDLQGSLEDFHMCVHIFGGTHSPSTANFALRRTSLDNVDIYGYDAALTLCKSFYVDDMLKSKGTVDSACKLLFDVKGMCAAGGFKLTKFISSSREVLQSIQEDEKSKGIKNIDLTVEPLPMERALGVCWCVENDTFSFRIILKDNPLTRRGILASISSVYDPLGFGAPFLLLGKRLLQQLCSDKMGWDDGITPEQRSMWERWRRSLPMLEKIIVPRCYKPQNFGDVSDATIHHFSDASINGYGQVSYLRLVNNEGQVHCSFLMGKSRVTPIKPVTIPRLELTAATTSVKVASLLRKEIDLPLSFQETFWTDSQVVLGYIKNQSKKFHMFVANRIQAIHEGSEVEQWRYVATKDNPADYASRGQDVKDFIKNSCWFQGPEFLWQSPNEMKDGSQYTVSEDDPEVKNNKKVKVNVVKASQQSFLSILLQRSSDWYRLKHIVATILRWRHKRKNIDVDLLCKAEVAIIKLVQADSFGEELEKLETTTLIEVNKTKLVKKNSCLYKLNPFIDEAGLIRVGGRLAKSDLERDVKHPIVLPKRSQVSEMIIRWCHKNVEHSGRGITLNELRQRGFFIISGNSRVRHVILKCVTCRRLRGKVGEQQMAPLLPDRMEEAPPFTYSAVDMFGPFWIKEGRKEMKKYVALFTCMSSRAVHLEGTNNLDTDSFILALRRFISRRGEVRQMRSDNGTNFIGANNELRKAIEEMDQDKVRQFLLMKGTDWLEWKFNTPTASHMGGIWERQIRSARAILASLLNTHGRSLNYESFRTLLTEVEAVINSRPLTVDHLSDSDSLAPITPNHLLTMKSKILMAPPGSFERADLYSRKRWRRIQHIMNEFWSRWKNEYLQSLQKRNKWQSPQRNLKVDDIVLMKEESIRNDWRMARVTKVKRDECGMVRSVTIRTSTNQVLDRPIHKLVHLLEANEDN